MFEVRVNGLRFRGSHGYFEAERASGNEFRAWVTATVDGSADKTDRLEDTVDYTALAQLLLEVSESRSFLTVEGLAGAFADQALARFPAVLAIEVALDKLAPPNAPPVESCGVRVSLMRD